MELDHARVAREVGVVDVEEVVLRVARTEGHRQEPELVAAPHSVADVEERARDPAVPNRDDAPRLLDDVERALIARRAGDVGRGDEAGGDRSQGRGCWRS